MRHLVYIPILSLLLAIPAVAQETQPRARDTITTIRQRINDLLQLVATLEGELPPETPVGEVCGNGVDDDQNGQIDDGCEPPPPPPPPPANAIDVQCPDTVAARSAAFQNALDSVTRPGTVTLAPGCTYDVDPEAIDNHRGFVFKPRPGTGRVRITTRGWTDKGPIPEPPGPSGLQGRAVRADLPRMAAIRAQRHANFALEVQNCAPEVPCNDTAGNLELFGVAFLGTPADRDVGPTGVMLKFGSAAETDPARVAKNNVVRQVIFLGDERTGQKRAVEQNGGQLLVTQSYCDEIFVNGQDSTCVGGWNGGFDTTIEYNYLAAGAENVIFGGAPIAGTTDAMTPRNLVMRWNLVEKPQRWQADGRNRQVKNLFELKNMHGARIHNNLFVRNWVAAQDGKAILLHVTTNGRCPQCGSVRDVIFEDNVILDSPSAISFQGYGYTAGYENADRLERITVRNNYFYLNGGGRATGFFNVLGRHDVHFERNTVRNLNGTQWFAGDYGYAVQNDGEPRTPGGPIQGLWLNGNVFNFNSRYGITAPSVCGGHFGSTIGTRSSAGCGPFVSEDLQIAGNVLGDAPAAHLANYNRHRGDGEANVSAPSADITARITRDTCGQWSATAGADCSRLAEVFAMIRLLEGQPPPVTPSAR